MGALVKVYSFLNNITLDASEINRNFDDLYTTINNLNSENIAAGYSVEASQITFSDSNTFYSASDVGTALNQIPFAARGHHTIHVMPDGTGSMWVFPGKVEINGKIAVVSARFGVSGLTNHDSGSDQCAVYVVCGQPATGEEITASDIFIIQRSSVGTTSGYSLSQAGYYYDSKRVIGAAYNPYATCQCFLNYYNPDPPKGKFVYQPISQTGHGLFGWTAGANVAGTGTYINLALIRYDQTIGAYGFSMQLRPNSATSVATEYLGDQNNAVIQDFVVHSTQSTVTFGNGIGGDLVLPAAGVGLAKCNLCLSLNVAISSANPSVIVIVARPLESIAGDNY